MCIRDSGSYEVEGKTYYATRQMEYTNRVFPGSYADKYEDGSYLEEWSAPGSAAAGNKVKIFMTCLLYTSRIDGQECLVEVRQRVLLFVGPVPVPGFGRQLAGDAVSYTHLDVYKRQL